jgi:MFS family permease
MTYSFWRALAYPLRYFPHPVVLIMTFHLATILMTVNYAITSNTFIYQGEYGFDVKRTGLTSLSPFLATCLALPYTGYLNDRYINRYRHRKDFQPEWRLKFFFLTLVLGPVGCIIMGVTAQNHANYATPLIGEGLSEFTDVAIGYRCH